MNIVNGLHERITDFENILEATKGKSYNEAFKWRGQIYHSYEEWADKCSGWGAKLCVLYVLGVTYYLLTIYMYHLTR